MKALFGIYDINRLYSKIEALSVRLLSPIIISLESHNSAIVLQSYGNQIVDL